MANKKSKIEEIHNQYGGEDKYAASPLNNVYDDDIFAELEAGDVQESTLPIMSIIPDETQPRRLVPAELKDTWDGTPEGFSKVIEAWVSEVHKRTDSFPIHDMLTGRVNVFDYDSEELIISKFVKLIDLAAQIADMGLRQAIGVVKRGDLYRIVYGERRWTAFQILEYFLESDYSRIPVRIANLTDWSLAKMQAAENFQRDELNAIAKARQFAKLVIIARSNNGDSQYDGFNQLVVNSDRPWYAQVANGEIHRIPRGMGPQFEQALGISTGQMRQYRNLLKLTVEHVINDAIWDLGDLLNWTESFMREIGQYLDTQRIDEIFRLTDAYTVTARNGIEAEKALRDAIKAAKEAEALAKKKAEKEANPPALSSPPIPPATQGGADTEPETVDKSGWPSYQWVGKEVYHGNSKVFVEDMTDEYNVIIVRDGERGLVHISTLIDTSGDADKADTPQHGPVDKNGKRILVGHVVKTRRGDVGQVTRINGQMVDVDVQGNPYLGKGQYGDMLEIIQPTAAMTHTKPATTDTHTQTTPTQHTLDDESPPENATYSDAIAWANKRVLWDGFKARVIAVKADEGMATIQFLKTEAMRDVLIAELMLDESRDVPDEPDVRDVPDDLPAMYTWDADEFNPYPLLSALGKVADMVAQSKVIDVLEFTRMNEKVIADLHRRGGVEAVNEKVTAYTEGVAVVLEYTMRAIEEHRDVINAYAEGLDES